MQTRKGKLYAFIRAHVTETCEITVALHPHRSPLIEGWWFDPWPRLFTFSYVEVSLGKIRRLMLVMSRWPSYHVWMGGCRLML